MSRRLSEQDLFLFNEGTHQRLYDGLGAHLVGRAEGRPGVSFAVWAPSAEAVSVIGDWNGWDETTNPLTSRGVSGIWEGFVPGVEKGALYKYRIRDREGRVHDKADPYGLLHEVPPKTASIVWELDYAWGVDRKSVV